MSSSRVHRRVSIAVLVALAWAGGSLVVAAGRSAVAQEEPTSSSPSAPIEARDPADQIVLSGQVTVRRGDVVGEVIVFHGAVDVAGVVRGDVLVFDGEILVTGQVSGAVVNVDGPVTLGPNAHVLGDVVARERIRVAEGAIVEGDVREGTSFVLRGPVEAFGAFGAWLAVAVSTLVLAALLLAIAPRGAEAVAVAASSSPWGSLGLGVGVAIALPLLAVVASVTLVGLPFGLALLLSLWLIASAGFALAVFAAGRAMWRAPRSRWLALLFGWLAVTAVSTIPWVGGVVWIAGAVFGLGAIALAIRHSRVAEEPPTATVGAAGRHRAGVVKAAERRPSSLVTGPTGKEDTDR
jgi:cytoskeletal protein CcmA (bactofilin family)